MYIIISEEIKPIEIIHISVFCAYRYCINARRAVLCVPIILLRSAMRKHTCTVFSSEANIVSFE